MKLVILSFGIIFLGIGVIGVTTAVAQDGKVINAPASKLHMTVRTI